MNTVDMPTFPACPDSLDPVQVEQFRKQGYLAFENVLSTEEVEMVKTGFTRLVDQYAFNKELADYVPGREGQTCGPLFRKKDSRFFFEFEKGYEPDPHDRAGLELKIRKLMYFEHELPVYEHICFRHPRVMGVLDSLLGEDKQLFQTMALVKPPQIGREKPWHQDNAYFAVTPLEGIIGVWFAIDDARIENGCMHVIEGGHELGPLKHHHTYDCEIEEGRIDKSQAVPIELKAGGALFFYGMLPHFTPPNRSGERRRSVQNHYHAAHCVTVEQEQYNIDFAEADGTPASCHAASLQDKI